MARSIRGLADGGTYRFAGGAPLWISSCGYAPTCAGRFRSTTSSDTAHIRRRCRADGTVVRNVNDGGFYRFAGGAPLFVRCDMGAGLHGADDDRRADDGQARHLHARDAAHAPVPA